jgi:benzoyl-CoA reductase/2-hydroxyglutaryl-CoA dehydratase subunit BcrC/BadD/HgdB
MKAPAIDLGRFHQMVEAFDSMFQHRRKNPTSRSSELYYDLSSRYWDRVGRAREEGKLLVGHSACVPPELFYALDMVPMHLELLANVLMAVLKQQEPFLALGKAYGLSPEVCSTHRAVAAAFTEGWAPRPDIVVWNNQVCDNTVKSNELVLDYYDVPGFYFDVPFRHTPEAERYLVEELEELVDCLGERFGRRLDQERLVEALELSRQLTELNSEISQLRRAVPTPGANRLGSMLHTMDFYGIGSPEGVEFYRAARDELREQAERGVGHVPQEKLRLLSLFMPMAYSWKLLDWMEREHGVCIVSEPYINSWNDMDWDMSQPMLTLARRMYAHPTTTFMHGPASRDMVDLALREAREAKVDGAIYWAHIGCRQSCAVIRLLKDALSEEAEVPTLVVEMDLNDPTFAPEEEIKNKMEGFFEMLEERR